MIRERLKIRTSVDGSKIWADANAPIGKGDIKCAFDLTKNCQPFCAACYVETWAKNANLDSISCFRDKAFIIGTINKGIL